MNQDVGHDVAGREKPEREGEERRDQRAEQRDRQGFGQSLAEQRRMAEWVGRHHQGDEPHERQAAAGEPHGRDVEQP